MLLITSIDMLPTLDDADRKVLATLTAKDRVVVISREGATMPVSLFQTMASLKCKLDIVEAETKDLFKLGYLYGMLASGAKQGEQVTILSQKEGVDLPGTNVYWTDKLSVKKSSKSGTTKAANSKPKVKESEDTTRAVTAQKPKANEEKPVRKSTPKTAPKGKIDSMEALVKAYPGLKNMKTLLMKSEESYKAALLASTDAEIGYQFQLQLRFGSDGDLIWKETKADFEKLKKDMA